MDTFGYTTWWNDDGGIGQDLAVLADDIDYYCPMVYPSTFNAGVPGAMPYPDVVSSPVRRDLSEPQARRSRSWRASAS